MTLGRVEFRKIKIATLLIFRNFGSSFPSLFLNGDIEKVEEAVVCFLPVYSVWTGIVVFVFPLVFHFT
jgi:hypothetical protein